VSEKVEVEVRYKEDWCWIFERPGSAQSSASIQGETLFLLGNCLKRIQELTKETDLGKDIKKCVDTAEKITGDLWWAFSRNVTFEELAEISSLYRSYRMNGLHKHSDHHRLNIDLSQLCGCFNCLDIFSPAEIIQWADEGETAICPLCGVDSVLHDQIPELLSKELLSEMHEVWFAKAYDRWSEYWLKGNDEIGNFGSSG
jgi:hypothetical protein